MSKLSTSASIRNLLPIFLVFEQYFMFMRKPTRHYNILALLSLNEKYIDSRSIEGLWRNNFPVFMLSAPFFRVRCQSFTRSQKNKNSLVRWIGKNWLMIRHFIGKKTPKVELNPSKKRSQIANESIKANNFWSMTFLLRQNCIKSLSLLWFFYLILSRM